MTSIRRSWRYTTKRDLTEAAGANTATTGEVHETSSSGLLAPAIKAIPPNQHLLNNESNDKAA
jgi:hypothetical protein